MNLLEYEFLAAALAAIVENKNDVTEKILPVIDGKFFEDKKLAKLWELIREKKELKAIFVSLNGEKQIFFDILKKSQEVFPLAAIPLAQELVNQWREREIKKLSRLYASADIEDKFFYHQKIKEINEYDPFDDEAKENILENILQFALKEEDFNQEFNWLYKDLILEGSLNIFFAPPSSGKSTFALALAIHLLKTGKVKEVFYLDGDNSMAVLQKRNIKSIIKQTPNLHYIAPGLKKDTKISKTNSLRQIIKNLSSLPRKDVLVIIDSLKDVAGGDISLDKTQEASKISNLLKNLRDSNGTPKTVIVLHHVNKATDTPTVFKSKGNTIFQDDADQTYFFRKVNQDHEAIYLELEEGKQKLSFKKFKFKVYFKEYIFQETDFILSREEQDIIETARHILEENRAALTFDELVKKVSKAGLPHKKVYYTLKEIGENFFVYKHEKFPRRILVSLPSWVDFDTDLQNCRTVENKGLQEKHGRTAELAELQNCSESTASGEKEETPTSNTNQNLTELAELQSLQNCRTIENKGFQTKALNINSSARQTHQKGNGKARNPLNTNSSAVLQKGQSAETLDTQDFCSSATHLNKDNGTGLNTSKPKKPPGMFCRECRFYKPQLNSTEGRCEKTGLPRAPDLTRCRYYETMP